MTRFNTTKIIFTKCPVLLTGYSSEICNTFNCVIKTFGCFYIYKPCKINGSRRRAKRRKPHCPHIITHGIHPEIRIYNESQHTSIMSRDSRLLPVTGEIDAHSAKKIFTFYFEIFNQKSAIVTYLCAFKKFTVGGWKFDVDVNIKAENLKLKKSQIEND